MLLIDLLHNPQLSSSSYVCTRSPCMSICLIVARSLRKPRMLHRLDKTCYICIGTYRSSVVAAVGGEFLLGAFPYLTELNRTTTNTRRVFNGDTSFSLP